MTGAEQAQVRNAARDLARAKLRFDAARDERGRERARGQFERAWDRLTAAAKAAGASDRELTRVVNQGLGSPQLRDAFSSIADSLRNVTR